MFRRFLLAMLISTSLASDAFAYTDTSFVSVDSPVYAFNPASPVDYRGGALWVDLRPFTQFRFTARVWAPRDGYTHAPVVFVQYRTLTSSVWRSLSADGCGGLTLAGSERNDTQEGNPSRSGICNIFNGARVTDPVQLRVVYYDGAWVAPYVERATVQLFKP